MEQHRYSALSSSTSALNSMVKSTEDIIEKFSTPSKSYFPAIGRFLLVICFLEDSLRIVMQWKMQVSYITQHRGFSHSFTLLALGWFALGMLIFSLMIIARWRTFPAACGLVSIIFMQAFVYGLVSEFEFIMRNISIIGGMLILMAEEEGFQQRKRSGNSGGIWAGLPSAITNYTREKATWFALFGRILLVSLVVAIVFAGDFGLFRVIAALVGLCISALVVVGFKAKLSALFLLATLCIFNVVINNWWAVGDQTHMRDFLKFDFFQTLSVVGGLVLLISTGPGHLSIDEKQKDQ